MPFTQTDFNENDVRTKLTVVINDQMGLPALHRFSELTTRQKSKFNQLMCTYISELPQEDYLEKLHKDFCSVMGDVFETLKPEECFVPSVNTNTLHLEKGDDLNEKLAELEIQQKS
jgi:hypothetical protein